MRYWKTFRPILSLPVILFGLAVVMGCDSGKKTVDEVTGNSAVKQYHQSEEDIKDIVDQQSQRIGDIPEEDDDDDKNEEE